MQQVVVRVSSGRISLEVETRASVPVGRGSLTNFQSGIHGIVEANGISTMSHDDQPDTRGTRTFLGLPYDWRRPTWARVRERAWNRDDPRLLTPKSYGWGYDINVYELLTRVDIVRR